MTNRSLVLTALGAWIGILSTILVSTSARAGDENGEELTPMVVLYSGDAMRGTLLGGFQLTHKFSRIYWIGMDFVGGTASVDSASGLGVRDGDRFYGVNGALYFNVPALLGVTMSGEKGLSADLYTSIGGGHLWLGSQTEFFGFLGGGMVLHLPLTWLAIRFDVKGLFFRLANAGGSDFNADMSLGIGPSFVF